MPVIGCLDEAGPRRIRGWAWDADRPGHTVVLCILADGQQIALVTADGFRADLEVAGVRGGRCAFDLDPALGPAFAPAVIRVLDEATGEDIANSPAAISPQAVGHLDEASHRRLRGWAWRAAEPHRPVEIDILIDGRKVASAIANQMRPDLAGAGIGAGRHGFEVDMRQLALPLTASILNVVDARTGRDITGSPARLEGRLELDPAARRSMQALLDSPGSTEDLEARVLFLKQQAGHLSRQIAERRSGASAADRGTSGRVLVIDTATPATGCDAGSNLIVSHMRSLQRLGFDVTFAAADMHGGADAATLTTFGIHVMCEPWTTTVEELLRRRAGGFEVVYLHRLESAQRYMALVREHMPRARIVFNVADLHHRRLLRKAEAEDRPELLPQIQHRRLDEYRLAATSHACVTHSDVEAAMLREQVPPANVHVVPWEIEVRATPASFGERSGLVFAGSYRHRSNVDAALRLVDEIMPLVWRQASGITCTLIGSEMPEVFRQARDPRIVALGHVKDLAASLGAARMTVAPLVYGAGLIGNLLGSLAAGVPCVCTTVAAEGLVLPDPLMELIADDASGLVRSIVRLHSDEALFFASRLAGIRYLQYHFSVQAVDQAMRMLMRSCGGDTDMTPVGSPPV